MADDVKVASSDGTELSVRVTGSGSPVVLVHGTTGSKDSWAFVEPAMAERHTVWAYDRRGRGGSGDADAYDYDREVDDLRAVVAQAGGAVHLVAHSFGARCAMDAAPELDDLLSLVLYEPPVHVAEKGDIVDRAAGHIEAGRIEDGLLLFFTELAGLSDDEIAMVRSVPPVWERFLKAAPTAAREARALRARPWDPHDVRSIDAPTMFLSGGATDLDVYPTRAEVSEAFPRAEHVDLPGQRHIAFATDPAGFAAAVLAFTSDGSS